MKTFIYSLLLNLLFGSFVLNAQTIEKFALCRNVEKLNPIEPANTFDKGARAYCWLRIKDAKPNSHIFLDWYWEGKLQHASKLTLTYAAQRTYGYKTLSLNGTWKVAVRDMNNRVLYEMPFKVGEGKDIDPALAKKDQNSPSIIVLNPKTPPAGEASKPSQGAKPREVVVEAVPANPVPVEPQRPALPSIAQLAAQQVQAPITEKSRLLLPSIAQTEAVPLVIMLPFTGGSAANLYSGYLYNLTEEVDDGQSGSTAQFQEFLAATSPQQPFALLLPSGVGTTDDHSAVGFSEAILRYEQRLFADIQRLQATMKISKVILCGYSLGGDLSWALMMRNPSLLNGAIVMGSRCGYMEDGHLPIMAETNAKLFLFSGSEDEEVRVKGMKWAKWQLDKAAVDYRYSEGEGMGHATIPADDLSEALGFVFE